MHTLQAGDFARIRKEGEPEYVKIASIQEKTVTATSQTTWEDGSYAVGDLEFLPPLPIDASSLQKLLRLETTYSAISTGATPFDNVRADEPVSITLEDLRQTIATYLRSDLTPEQFAEEWYWPLWDILFEAIHLEEAQTDPRAAFRGPLEFFTEYTAFAGAWADLSALAHGYDVDLNQTLQDLNLYFADEGKPVLERRFPIWVKRTFLRTWCRPQKYAVADETVRTLYQRFYEELLALEDPFAIQLRDHAAEGQEKA